MLNTVTTLVYLDSIEKDYRTCITPERDVHFSM